MTDLATDPMMPAPEPEREGPPLGLTPREWMKRNLFNTPVNSVMTVIFGLIILFVGFRLSRWVLVTAEWEPVQRNLTLFMMGTFDRDEQWRLIVSTILTGVTAGGVAGLLAASARDTAAETGEPYEPSSPADLLRRFWPVISFFVIILIGTRTFKPWLFAAGVVASAVAARFAFATIPARLRGAGWALAGILGFASLQVVSGTAGRAWWGPGLILGYAGWRIAQRFVEGKTGPARTAIPVVGAVVGAGISRAVYALPFMDFGSVEWSDWSGMHLTLFATVVSISMAFPIGLMLALARRSSFPAFRVLAVAYIELIRGVPLITLLLMAQFFIAFFIPSAKGIDLLTRALIALTMFTAAYIAEIVRGGLQSVPRGQVEAGQALGLAAPKVTRLIVLPQALRAVIPAMVGQFISLFKDTSLLVIIGITEFLGVRSLVHGQPAFRAGFQEMTLVFIAFGYWAFAYTMSRESQRLERRLGGGSR